jgi:hypothetical protein
VTLPGSHIPPPHPEPLSPELVLVDEVLAARARALLPDRPWIEPVRLEPVPKAAAVAAPAAPFERIPASAAERLEPVATPTRRPWGRTAGVALAGAAVVALALDLFPSRGPEPRLAPADRDRSVQRALSPTNAVAATQPPPVGKSIETPRPKAPAKKPNAAAIAEAENAIDTSRTFVWPEAANAAGYEFQLFRGAQLVFRARATTPRIVLPDRWTYGGKSDSLRPGTYRWYVWPVVRGADGPVARAIVQADLVVTR